MDLEIRFYDNEEKNWSGDMIQHSPSIQFIEVDNTTPHVFISSVPIVGKTTIANTNKTYNQAYINAFASQGNTYAQFLNKVIKSGSADESKKIVAKDYPNNGFQPYIPELMGWANLNNHGQKCVIFDWDKTMTAVEGMYFGDHAGENIMIHDVMQIALFVMGGPDRLSMVQQAIAGLRSMRVQIFIITNNPNASLREPSRDVYLALITLIFGVSHEEANYILYCAKDYGFKKWKSTCAIDILRPQLRSCHEDASSATSTIGLKMSEAVARPQSLMDIIDEAPKTASKKGRPKKTDTTIASADMMESFVPPSTEKKEPTKGSSRKTASNVGFGVIKSKKRLHKKHKTHKYKTNQKKTNKRYKR